MRPQPVWKLACLLILLEAWQAGAIPAPKGSSSRPDASRSPTPVSNLSPESSPTAASPASPPAPSPPSPSPSPSLVIPPQFPLHKGVAVLGEWQATLKPGGAMGRACGFGHVEEYAQVRFGAINQKLYGDACGRCVAVACASPALCAAATSAVLPAMLIDDCGHCGVGDIQLSCVAFREVTGLIQGSAPVDWFFIPCGPFIRGGIRLDVMPGSNDFYHQLTFSNSADPIVKASINGQPLQATDWHRWTWHNNGQPIDKAGPLTIRLTGSTGAVREASLPELGGGQHDLAIQF